MPARKPQTPRPRDQMVAFDSSTDEGKQRMLGELARLQAAQGARVAALSSPVVVEGSRASGDALESLLAGFVSLGLITDRTTP